MCVYIKGLLGSYIVCTFNNYLSSLTGMVMSLIRYSMILRRLKLIFDFM